MKLLVIEDDPKIANFVSEALRKAGHAVEKARDGSEGLARALANPYDLLILDLMLPGTDGLEVLTRLREQGVRTPVIIVSARRSVEERILGIRSGGDDYLVKPSSMDELLVRIESIARRSQPESEPSVLANEDLRLNLLRREAFRGSVRIDLQPREFLLLETLMRNAGRALSKTYILERIWNYRFDPQTNVVDVLVCRLRSKVDKGFSPPLIHTLRGVGYVFGKR